MNGRNKPRTRSGNALAERRVGLGWTQDEAARRIGVNRGLVAKWECGTIKPSADSLIKMARAYDCTVDDLLN